MPLDKLWLIYHLSLSSSKIYLKNYSPLSIILVPKLLHYPVLKLTINTHLKVVKLILDIVLSRKLACVHMKRLYWKGLCTLWIISVVAAVTVAVSNLYCRYRYTLKQWFPESATAT